MATNMWPTGLAMSTDPGCCFQGNCCGYKDVLEAYKQIIPDIEFSGPTNFTPLIHRAMDIVHSTRKVAIFASQIVSIFISSERCR